MQRVQLCQSFEPSAAYPYDATPPVDLSYLRRYTLGNVEVEKEVLELFCAHAPTVLADMKRATDEKTWRDGAHTLKGSALSLGALRIAQLAEQAELAAPSFSDCGDLIEGLEAAFEEARDFIAAATAQQ